VYSSNKINLIRISEICGFSLYPDEINIWNNKNQNGDVSWMKLTCYNRLNGSFLTLNIDDLEKDNINVVMNVSIQALFKDGKCVIDHSIKVKSEDLKMKMNKLNDYYKLCLALTDFRPSYTNFKFEIDASFAEQEAIYKSCFSRIETAMSPNLGKIINDFYGIETNSDLFETIDNIIKLYGWVYSPETLNDLLSVIKMQRI